VAEHEERVDGKRVENQAQGEEVEGVEEVEKDEVEDRQGPVSLPIAGEDEAGLEDRLADVAAGPAQVHLVHALEGRGHGGVDDGVGLIADILAGPQDQRRQGPVLAVVAGLVEEPLVQELRHQRGDDRLLVGRQRPGAADHSAVGALVGPAVVEGDGVPDREHPGQEVVLLVEYGHPAGHASRLGVLDQGLDDVAQGVAAEQAVGVEGDHDIALGLLDPDIESLALAEVLLEAHDLQPAFIPLAGLQHVMQRQVLGAVVDADDVELVLGVVAGKDRVDGVADEILLVEGGRDHGDLGPHHGVLAKHLERLVPGPEEGLQDQGRKDRDGRKDQGVGRQLEELGASQEVSPIQKELALDGPDHDQGAADNDAKDDDLVDPVLEKGMVEDRLVRSSIQIELFNGFFPHSSST